MCLNCFSTGEVLAANATIASGFSSHLIGRFHLRRKSTEQRIQRRQRIWDQNATFLAELGHDPAVLLGPRPADLPSRQS